MTNSSDDDAPPAPPMWPFLRVVALAAGVVLMGMMLLTGVDVIGRYFFNIPVPGSAEATEFMLALIVFAGLPVAAARREHIQIDLIDHVLPAWLLRWQRVFGFTMAGIVVAFMGWRLLLRGNELHRLADRSSHLDLPTAGFAWFMAAMSAVAIAVFVAVAIRAWRGRL